MGCPCLKYGCSGHQVLYYLDLHSLYLLRYQKPKSIGSKQLIKVGTIQYLLDYVVHKNNREAVFLKFF